MTINLGPSFDEFKLDSDSTDSIDVQRARHTLIKLTRCRAATIAYYDAMIRTVQDELAVALSTQNINRPKIESPTIPSDKIKTVNLASGKCCNGEHDDPIDAP